MHRLVSFPEAEGPPSSRGNALGLPQAHFLSPETAARDGDVYLQRRSWSFSKAWAPYLFMFDMKASSILVGLLVICSNPCLAEEAPAARKLYVANTAGESLSLIDLDRREVVRELQIGKHPHGLAVAPDQGVIYCSVRIRAGHQVHRYDRQTR
jgi:hypothetical protein